MGKILKTMLIGIFCMVMIGMFSINARAITINEIITFVNQLDVMEFTNSDIKLKDALGNDLDSISEVLNLKDEETDADTKVELREDAIYSLDLLKDKSNGCIAAGSPDENDWFVNCTTQLNFHGQVDELINQLTTE